VTRGRLIALGQQRARLIGRARVEREHLDTQVTRIESALSWVDVARKGVHEARRHPLIVALAIAIVVAVRPRNAVNLMISGLSVWRLYKRARRLWTLASALAASAAQTQAQ
jgi:hypothetical protein